MNLSENFTLAELTESQAARRKGYKEQFSPPLGVVSNLQELCEKILQPLRDKVGPIKINSGYRCERVNKDVGGQPSSQHLTGQAADIEGINVTNAELFAAIQSMNLPFDQCIWEFGTKENPAWVHVSCSHRNRRQILYIPKNLKP